MTAIPYRSTAIFDEASLPAALRREHRTKKGVWGVIRLLEGKVRFISLDPWGEAILTPDEPGFVQPEQVHFVEPLGPMRMQVDFYDSDPNG